MTERARQLEYLSTRVATCDRCPLHRHRARAVFGNGAHNARMMLVGEAPGAEEDRRGQPFVGPSGQLLDEWLRIKALQRADVYVTNVCKCRPLDNRDPYPTEEEACAPFLHVQIHLVQPRVLVALGRHAANALTGQRVALNELRGIPLFYEHPRIGGRIPIVATFHPGFVLRKGRQAVEPDVLADLDRAIAFMRAL